MTFWGILGYSLWFFVWMMFLLILFFILSDLFRDRTTGGLAKAAWIIVLIFVPILGALSYILFRGEGMFERARHEAQALEDARRAYIREVAASPADELEKLVKLRDEKFLTEEEFQSQKAKVLKLGT